MNRGAFAIAVALVRAWTWVYTSTLDPHRRDRRRTEIEADLWAAAHDDVHGRSAMRLLLRAGGGLHDDVAWALEQPQDLVSIGRASIALGTIALIGWLVTSSWIRVTRMPLPDVAPTFTSAPFAQHLGAPPPPPPPPPPCLPPGMSGSPVPCTR